VSAPPASAVGGPAVQIAAVELAERGQSLHGNLERPSVGEPVPGFCVPLSGWALAPDGTGIAILDATQARIHVVSISSGQLAKRCFEDSEECVD